MTKIGKLLESLEEFDPKIYKSGLPVKIISNIDSAGSKTFGGKTGIIDQIHPYYDTQLLVKLDDVKGDKSVPFFKHEIELIRVH
jgi:hypothetical protein